MKFCNIFWFLIHSILSLLLMTVVCSLWSAFIFVVCYLNLIFYLKPACVTYCFPLSYVHHSLSFFSVLTHIYVLLLFSCCHGLFPFLSYMCDGSFLSFFSSSFHVVIGIFLRCSSMGFFISGILPFSFHIYIQLFSCGERHWARELRFTICRLFNSWSKLNLM